MTPVPANHGPGSGQAVSIPAAFATVVSAHGGRVAVSAAGEQWTYAQLDAHSGAIAAAILKRAGNMGQPIALLLDHDAWLIASIVGVLRSGHLYVSLDPVDPAARLAAVVNDAEPCLIVTDRSHEAMARSVAGDRKNEIMLIEDAIAGSESVPTVEVSADADAWLMYTSGSTGEPKGVLQSHANVIHHTTVFTDLIGITPEDRLTLLTSCGLAASGTALFGALLNGAALCPFPLRTQGVDRLVLWLRHERPTIYHSVPTVFRHVCRALGTEERLESLRWIRLGGEPVLAGDVDLFRRHTRTGCRLMNALSSTETGLISQFTVDHQMPIEGSRLPVGKAVVGVEIRTLGEDDRPVPAGSPGRLQVRSRHLSPGYWRRPELTARVFREDAAAAGLRLFCGDDLVCLRADGQWDYLGRRDELVKIRGLRVDLAAVETALRALPGVREAAVVAPENQQGERALVAYLAPRPVDAGTLRAWRQGLQRSLAAGMVPTRFVCLAELPHTAGGKIDRLALPAALEPRAGHRPHRAPKDPVQSELAGIWESVLDVEAVGLDDDFFDLGGTSLQSAQVLARIESRFGISLPPPTLVQHSTLEQLAALVIPRGVQVAAALLIPLREGGTGRPLFLVHPGHGNVAIYAPLARLLESSRPVFALRASGIEGECWPLGDLRRMARRYIDEIRKVCPVGPYLLAGNCLGGLVAYEMAVQLTAAGEAVPFVGLIASALGVGADRSAWSEAFPDEVRYRIRLLRWAIARSLGAGRAPNHLPSYRRFLADVHAHARRAYRPGRFEGAVTLFVAEEHRRDPLGRQLRIREYARESRIIEVPGMTADILQPPNIRLLARHLDAAIGVAERAVGGA